MTVADWPEVARIYVEGIETGMATFETTAPSWEEWNAAAGGRRQDAGGRTQVTECRQ